MAQINTTFGFRDEITQNLSLMNNMLTTLNRTLQDMKNSMSGGVNPAMEATDDKAKKVTKSVEGLNVKLLNFNAAADALRNIAGVFGNVTGKINEMAAAYDIQAEAELKTETVMRNHLHATEEEIQSLKDLASAEQGMGIYGDEMILNGVQELATYVDNVETLKGLVPIMNSMLAQGVGARATANDMQSYATMIGKVMQGQVGGMSKRGYKFTDEEEAILKTGTEMQKLKVLQEAVLGNFGNMNYALAGNAAGKIQQLKNNMGDLKEVTGGILKPLQQELTIFQNTLMVDFYGAMNKVLGKIVPKIVEFVQFLERQYDKLKQWLEPRLKAFVQLVEKKYEGIKQGLVRLRNFIIVHFNEISSVVVAAIGVIIGALVVLGARYIWCQRQAIIAAVKTAAAWVAAHLPIALIILAIIALIGVIGLLLATSEKSFPMIGGFIGGVAGIAKEVCANIKYYFGSMIEIVVNGFRKMKDKVGDFFLTMVEKIAGGLELIAPVIDIVFNTNAKESLQNFRRDIIAMKNKMPERFSLGWTDSREGFKNAWAQGKAEGEQVGAGLSATWKAWQEKMLAKFKGEAAIPGMPEMPDATSIEDFTSPAFDFKTDSSGALVVTDKSLVDIADDYRDLLSRQATERFNLRFSQVTPQVSFGDVVVNSESDSDNIIEDFVDKMTEAASTYLGR